MNLGPGIEYDEQPQAVAVIATPACKVSMHLLTAVYCDERNPRLLHWYCSPEEMKDLDMGQRIIFQPLNVSGTVKTVARRSPACEVVVLCDQDVRWSAAEAPLRSL